ncbi:MAG: o-succinylbenzoate synthase [Balneolaceae bacterium]|nr:o-succinylbenzoate synthase [Balneolaceae bacterium]
MFSVHAYKIPFSSPFQLAGKRFETRKGLILSFTDGDVTAYGEVAPLPGFSSESLEEILTVLLQNQRELDNAFRNGESGQLLSVLHSIHKIPSLSFGLDTLQADYLAKKAGVSLCEHLFGRPFVSPKVNATLGIQDLEKALKSADNIYNDGFRTFKIKVGSDHKREIELIQRLREKFPEIQIRIDANQAWQTEEAVKKLTDFSKYNIEYCEQPVDKHDIDGMKKITASHIVPIAADEAVRSIRDAKLLIQEKACNLLILKPALFGRIGDLIVTKEWANTHSIHVVLTTAFDSIIGRTITAVLASGLGSDNRAHGLATSKFLNEPYRLPNEVHAGKYVLPDGAGITHSIDLSYFKKIA